MTSNFSRRSFLHDAAATACCVAGGGSARALATQPVPILDAHIHLFDPTRPGGIPWPTPADTALYRPALPPRYAALARPEGVLGAIAIEASPLASDNDWLLKTAAQSELIVGVIGDLDPGDGSFGAELDRLAAHPLFLGIRYGNLWHRDLGQHLDDREFLANLRRLSERGLVFESANPNPQLVRDLLRLTTKLPDLRVVIDHLPQAVPPADPLEQKEYLSTLKELRQNAQVFVKGSEIPRRIDGAVPLTLSTYAPWLTTLWDLFGEDRLFFGSDWPNSDQLTTFSAVTALARSYLASRTPTAAQKFFWSNSRVIYKWHPRTKAQRNLVSSCREYLPCVSGA